MSKGSSSSQSVQRTWLRAEQLFSSTEEDVVQGLTFVQVGTPLMSFSMGDVSARGPFFTCSACPSNLAHSSLLPCLML